DAVWTSLEDDPIAQVTTLTNNAILELLEHVLGKCVFTWESTLYRQRSGLPMGGRLSPIIANIYMEFLEHQVLCTTQIRPKTYFRYVDDVFVVWNTALGSHKPFLEALNRQHPDIDLTEEMEVDGSLPFLDILITRPKVDHVSKQLTPLQLAVYRKPTFSNRYIHYHSSHPLYMKENIFKGLVWRAYRILSDFPVQLRQELLFLKRSFCHPNNEYPDYVIDKWLSKFRYEMCHYPERLAVRTRLNVDDVFDANGCQIFSWPLAVNRFPPCLVTEDPGEGTRRELELQESIYAQLFDESTVDLATQATQTDGTAAGSSQQTDPASVSLDTGATQARAGIQTGHLNEVNMGRVQFTRSPILFVPFVPGIGDHLKRLAATYNVKTWFSFPGKTMDQFNQHRGKIHQSKSMYSVYCTQCTCGLQYIGESARNLKTHLAEHKHRSSRSAISLHVREKEEEQRKRDPTQKSTHEPDLQKTLILASERNVGKRRIIESLCIEAKRSRICNFGPSTELPGVWSICAPAVAKEISYSD
ncbi:MAG: hypothetical protein GY847_09560, partial [Proteobacteria bacterium]|nr:hypothetical protein [Pseudomonadota bacterium]